MLTRVAERTQAGWSNWQKVSKLVCDLNAPVSVKGPLYKVNVRSAMLCGINAVLLIRS